MDKSYRCLCSNNHGVVLQPIRAANKKLIVFILPDFQDVDFYMTTTNSLNNS